MGKVDFADGTSIEVDDRVVKLIQHLSERQKPIDIGVREFIERFKHKYIFCDLQRIGGDGDGGYLVPEIMNEISYCFSPGVSDVANFEKELAEKYGIKSYMADASVNKPPIDNKMFNFIPKFLGSKTSGVYTTLTDWIESTSINRNSAKILQMDIEGGEYDVLTYEDSSVLKTFDVIIIEFHWLNKMFEPMFLKMLSAIFEKLYQNFSICHAHPNNCCGMEIFQDIKVPRVLEVTFINNDLSNMKKNKSVKLPHPEDQPNVLHNEDISMPEMWWK